MRSYLIDHTNIGHVDPDEIEYCHVCDALVEIEGGVDGAGCYIACMECGTILE